MVFSNQVVQIKLGEQLELAGLEYNRLRYRSCRLEGGTIGVK